MRRGTSIFNILSPQGMRDKQINAVEFNDCKMRLAQNFMLRVSALDHQERALKSLRRRRHLSQLLQMEWKYGRRISKREYFR